MPNTVSAAATGLPNALPNPHAEAAQVIAELTRHMTLAGVGEGVIKFEVEMDADLLRRIHAVCVATRWGAPRAGRDQEGEAGTPSTSRSETEPRQRMTHSATSCHSA